MTLNVAPFHDPRSGTITYVVSETKVGACAVIDPVIGFDLATEQIDTQPLGPVIDYLQRHQHSVQWILDTHVHADHLSGARHLQRVVGGRTGIGRCVIEVQQHFGALWNLPLTTDGSQFDRLYEHGATVPLGPAAIEVMHTPGHTPACVTYLIGDNAFVGDTLFMPDSGTARCDFPGGDAAVLYNSLQRLLMLAPQTRIFVGHDYGADGQRPACWESTVGEQRASNVHLSDGRSEADFVALRTARDATLAPPRLMKPALRFNLGVELAGA